MFTDITKEIKAGDVKRLLFNVYRRYTRGEINETRAQREAYILNSILKAIELTDLETRLQQIENTLRNAD